MDLGKTILNILVSIIPIISIIYIVLGIRFLRIKERKLISFSLFLFASGLYSLGYFFELSSLSLDAFIVSRYFEFLGMLFVPTFGILFISELCNIVLKKKTKILLMAVSFIFWIFSVTNPLHHLVYKNIEIVVYDYLIPFTTRGPLFYAFIGYFVVFLAYSIVVLGKAKKLSTQIGKRRSFNFLFIVFQIPWLTVLFILLGFDKFVDPTPITIMIMCIFFLFNEIKNSMFDLEIKRWKDTFFNINQPAFLFSKENEKLCSNIYADDILDKRQGTIGELVEIFQESDQNNTSICFFANNQIKWFSAKKSDYSIKKSYTNYLLIDVTEKRLYHQKLESSEKNYRTFFDTMDDIILIGTKDGNIIYSNLGATKKLGYTFEEFTTMNVLNVHSSDNKEKTIKVFADMLLGRTKISLLPLKTKTGNLIPVETRVWFGEWNGQDCIFGISKDLTIEQEALQKFNKFFDNNPALMAVRSFAEKTYVEVNDAFLNDTGYTKEEVIGKTSEELNLFVVPNNQNYLMERLENEGKLTSIEIQIKRKNGDIIHGLFSGEVIESQGKKFFLTVMIDITERKMVEKVNEQQSQLIVSLLDSIPDMIFYKDTDFKYLGCNPVFEKYVGKTENEIVGKTDYDLFSKDVADSFRYNDMEMFKIQKPRHNEELITYNDGKNSLIDTIKTPYYNQEGKTIGIIGISRDISERKLAEEKITYLSYHDQLTGLYNRRYYEEVLKKLNSKENLPLALVMADVNGLKLTNDAFGHQSGDALLQKIADIIKNECRINDLVARIGGDEFVILLPKTNTKDVETMITRINTILKEHKTKNGILSVSFGYAIKKNMSDDINNIFKKAEDEMYKRKLSESPALKNETINIILDTLYKKSEREKLHSERVSEICESIATKMNFNKECIEQIKMAGLMHDIGKIGIDEVILEKSQSLSDEEKKEIKRHSEIGYRILSSVNDFSEIANFVLAHHERWDGKGYPKGLVGEEIPMQSRIISVADSFDAMTNNRPYRKALKVDDAVRELQNGTGTQFDPNIVTIFINEVLRENKQK